MQTPEDVEVPAPNSPTADAGEPEPGADAAVQAGLIDAVIECERVIAAAMAARAVAIDAAWRWAEDTAETGKPVAGARWDAAEVARREMLAELACALRMPEGTVGRLVLQSQALVHELAATQALLKAGLISYRHARAVIEHAGSLPEPARARYEARVLPDALTLTVAKFERVARRVRERAHPETILVRNRKCLLDRRVYFQAERDGMGTLVISTSAQDGQAAFNRISDLAKSLQGPDEPRTLAQLRTDVAGDLLLDGETSSGLGRGVRAVVNVTVPVLSLLGVTEEPAELDGYGPIDPETARKLAGTATGFTRILTQPETGCVLSVTNNQFPVPAELKRWLQIRDGTCRFPGCSRPARGSDIDHTTAKQIDGQTVYENLAHLCKPHHALKHQTAWSVRQGHDGTLHWASPAGKQYATDPATRIRVETPIEAAKRRKHSLLPPRQPALQRPPTPDHDTPPPF